MSSSSDQMLGFLKSFYVGKSSEEYTHILTTVENESRKDYKLNIISDKLSFWNLYFNALAEQVPLLFSLTEKPADYVPLIIDIEHKYINDQNIDIFSDDFDPNEYWDYNNSKFLLALHKVIVQTLKKHIKESSEYDFNGTSYQFLGFYLDSNASYSDNDANISISQRLQFPFIKTSFNDFKFLREKIVAALTTNNVFSRLKVGSVGDINSRVGSFKDRNVNMYGTLNLDGKFLTFKAFINNGEITETIDYDAVFDLNNHSLINHSDFSSAIVRNEDFPNPGYECIPFYLSLNFNLRHTNLIDNTKKFKSIAKKSEDDYYFRDSFTKEDRERETLMTFLSMINSKRYLKFYSWHEISDAIYNAYAVPERNEMAGFDVFVKCTLDAIQGLPEIPKFMLKYGDFETTCMNIYIRKRDSRCFIDYRTIAWYAMEDNEPNYRKWHYAWYSEALVKAIDEPHDDNIAEVFYRMFWLDFYFTPSSKYDQQWWYFARINHRLVQCKRELKVREKLSTEFINAFLRMRTLLSKKLEKAEDESEKADIMAKTKKIDMIIKSVGTTTKKTSIMKALEVKFKNLYMMESMNANINILGIENGVLHFADDASAIYHRSGKPQDYISISCKVSLNQSYTMESPAVKELLKWFGQMFKSDNDKSPEDSANPNKNQYLRYVLKTVAGFLFRKNLYKFFIFFKGGMNNAKSIFIKLIVTLFGPYQCKSDASNITMRNKNSSGPSPQNHRMKNRCVTIYDEIGSGDFINGDVMKRACGNDSSFSRDLNESGEDVEGTVKHIATTNTMPRFSRADAAAMARILIFPFRAIYEVRGKVSRDPIEQWKRSTYPVDENFDSNLNNLVGPLLWLMYKFFPKIKEEGGLKENIPYEIMRETSLYWDNSDMCNLFFKNRVRRVNTGSKTSLSTFYDSFKIWYKRFSSYAVPDIISFRESMEKVFGMIQGIGWTNLIIIEEGDDQEQAETVIPNYQSQSSMDAVGNASGNGKHEESINGNVTKRSLRLSNKTPSLIPESSLKASARQSAGRNH